MVLSRLGWPGLTWTLVLKIVISVWELYIYIAPIYAETSVFSC